jgi:hypothetical protein
MSERLKQVQKRIMDSIENVGKSPLTKKYFDFSVDDLKSLQEKGTQAQVLLNCKKIMPFPLNLRKRSPIKIDKN